jgi:hypothetical protein
LNVSGGGSFLNPDPGNQHREYARAIVKRSLCIGDVVEIDQDVLLEEGNTTITTIPLAPTSDVLYLVVKGESGELILFEHFRRLVFS